jgi:glutamine---fructose-6-phosphate transaminase (isomerizing)
MEEKDTRYASFGEIYNQPEGWSAIISQVLAQTSQVRTLFNEAEEIIFTGCGSGLNASLSGAPLFQMLTGITSRAVPAYDVYRFPKSALNSKRKTVAVLSSRSGQTTEVINALHVLKEHHIPTLGITCTEGSPLALESDLPFVLASVTEQAVITTRSLTGMILTDQILAALVAEDQYSLAELRKLPEVCSTRMGLFHDMGREIGQRTDLDRYAFLANGHLAGIAHESQLKVKEMVLLPSDAYPALDFRHGPKSNVNERMLVTVFQTDSAGKDEVRVIRDMKSLNGVTWAICDRAIPGQANFSDYVMEVGSGLGEWSRIILYLPSVQFMAYYRAIANHLNPDEPHNLSYWIDTHE